MSKSLNQKEKKTCPRSDVRGAKQGLGRLFDEELLLSLSIATASRTICSSRLESLLFFFKEKETSITFCLSPAWPYGDFYT